MDEHVDEIEKAALTAYRMYVRSHKVPRHDQDDILADARLGACQAASRWSPDRGKSMHSWAVTRAHGEIVDGARRMLHGTRTYPRYDHSLDEMVESGKHSPFLLANQQDPIEVIEDVLAASQIATKVLAMLPEKLRYVMHKKYFEGMDLVQIGKELGVTGSRACQMHTQAVKMIRENYVAD